MSSIARESGQQLYEEPVAGTSTSCSGCSHSCLLGSCSDIKAQLTFEPEAPWQEILGKPSALMNPWGWVTPRLFLLHRTVLALLWASFVHYDLYYNTVVAKHTQNASYWIWLTHQNNWTVAAFLCLNASCIFFAIHGTQPAGSPTPVLVRVNFALGAVAFPGSMMVCLIQWLLLGTPSGFTEIVNHSINALITLDEVLWSRRSFYPLQGWPYVVYGNLFLVFSYIYYKLGGTDGLGHNYIYTVLDWSKPRSALVFALLVNTVFFPLLYCTVVGLAAFRTWAGNRCCSSQQKEEQKEHELLPVEDPENVKASE